MKTRKHKIDTVKQLVYSTDKTLTADEHAFLQQHGYKQQVFMFVHTEEEQLKAQRILQRIEDTDTLVMLVSAEDLKL